MHESHRSIEKPEAPRTQGLSLDSSCDDQSLLYAAAAARRVSPDKYFDYYDTIQRNKRNELVENIYEDRNVAMIDYLELVEKEWLRFLKKLHEVVAL